jgi:hypothetical protein
MELEALGVRSVWLQPGTTDDACADWINQRVKQEWAILFNGYIE